MDLTIFLPFTLSCSSFFFPFFFVFFATCLLSTIGKIERIVGKVGHVRSRTIFEDFRKPLRFFLFLLLLLIYSDETLRRPGILEKMICLIVRGREISRSYHQFCYDVPCELTFIAGKKYGAIVRRRSLNEKYFNARFCEVLLVLEPWNDCLRLRFDS